MIDEIEIAGVGNFPKTANSIMKLGLVNYFYGANGSGKTTISRILDQEYRNTHPDYANCQIKWKKGKEELPILVFNRDFVRKHFESSEESLSGVYSFGDGNDVQAQLETLSKEIEDLKLQINSVEEEYSAKASEIKNQTDNLTKSLWDTRNKLFEKSSFEAAFDGLYGAKNRLFEATVNIWPGAKSADLLSVEELKNMANELYLGELKETKKLNMFSIGEIEKIESQSLLETPIVGGASVPIAALIKMLQNSDWVNSGRKYLDNSDGKCPFCQSDVPHDLESQLSEFFGEEYEKSRELVEVFSNSVEDEYTSIENIITSWFNETKSAMSFLEEPDASKYLDPTRIQSIEAEFSQIANENRANIKRKLEQPSLSVGLVSIGETVKKLNQEIDKANNKAEENNKLLASIDQAKVQLKEKIYRRLTQEVGFELSRSKIQEMETERVKIDNKRQEIRKQLDSKNHERTELEKQITNIQAAVDFINGLLRSYGFTNFHLEMHPSKEGRYIVVRENGDLVEQTLSEGEKTFLSFLYFYYIAKGSLEASGVLEKRIVVIDDPISSLDSSVLYIVSNLVNELKSGLAKGAPQKEKIPQILVLSHNMAFLRQVTYRHGSENIPKYWAIWMVRKSTEGSRCEKQTEFPLFSSYEMLWEELRLPDNSQIKLNVMRRIVEEYLVKFGGLKSLEEIPKKFEGTDKIACQSFLSCVHSGSHFASFDEISHDPNHELEAYERVFKKIFVDLGHEAHYNMMMNRSENEAENL